jgi:dTDP-4-dehydrorhamnose 3,5-epimerase
MAQPMLSSAEAIKKISTSLPEVFALEPRIFRDERGFFLESYNRLLMAEIGIEAEFVQDNHSSSSQNVLRGLHYQLRQPQGKLVRVVEGEILDVAVDLRRSSPFFGRWDAVRLSTENHRMLWIPTGFAHGFRVISERAQVLYKATGFYSPENERTLAWNDPQLKINWELDGEPIVSAKDQRGMPLADAETFE